MAKNKRKTSKKREKPRKKVSKKREKEEMDRAQVWSVDVLLAVVIFISVILIFYVTMTPREKPDLKGLEAVANELKIQIEKNNDLGFIIQDEVDEARFNIFVSNITDNYTELKQKLGIQGEFCIFYEDADGNLILIGDNKTSIGNPNIYINGTPCGTEVS